ncbi:hypothetical protein [Pseudomonas fluorescens]|uniref:hypothetical protein n=1 Tax=Pseudomonas fluorescens TaxID=294 RepID=UPI0005FB087A|nr:hypothetical protein [Pseudomonas fluorescens]KJZ41346.1 hypothetical protein VC33_00425 [Pseudomonas fluorescens]
MNHCPKCTSNDLLVTFTPKGLIIDYAGRRKIEDEFVTSNQYEFYWQHKSAKDHLRKHCRTCQFQWRENTADEVAP